MRKTRRALAGISAAGALAPHDLFGQLNQDALGVIVAQLAKEPEQAQFEQGLQRFIVRTGRGFSLAGSVLKVFRRKPERMGNLSEAAGITL